MLGKLVAVVHGQRVDLFLEIIQRTYEHVGYVIGVLGEDWLDAGEATLPFDQGQQGVYEILCVNDLLSLGESPLKHNGKSIERRLPIPDGHGPLLGDIL